MRRASSTIRTPPPSRAVVVGTRSGLARLAMLAIGFMLAAPIPAFAQDVGLALGSTPPAAQVEDLDGNAVDLSRYVGKQKPVLFEFWATWCPLCKALEPRMQEARKQFGDRVDFVVVAVAVNETPGRIKRHLETSTAVGPVFFDAKGAAVRAFEAPTTSYVVILDATGKVAYTGTGSDQPIAETLGRVLGATAR
jgi:thiol-disulfide isomerase/thioredoxin